MTEFNATDFILAHAGQDFTIRSAHQAALAGATHTGRFQPTGEWTRLADGKPYELHVPPGGPGAIEWYVMPVADDTDMVGVIDSFSRHLLIRVYVRHGCQPGAIVGEVMDVYWSGPMQLRIADA